MQVSRHHYQQQTEVFQCFQSNLFLFVKKLQMIHEPKEWIGECGMGLFTPWRNPYGDNAERAIEKLTNQKKLEYAVKEAYWPEARILALKKLTNPQTIAQIAQNEKEVASVRLEAIQRVTDEKTLLRIVCQTVSEEISNAALKKY